MLQCVCQTFENDCCNAFLVFENVCCSAFRIFNDGLHVLHLCVKKCLLQCVSDSCGRDHGNENKNSGCSSVNLFGHANCRPGSFWSFSTTDRRSFSSRCRFCRPGQKICLVILPLILGSFLAHRNRNRENCGAVTFAQNVRLSCLEGQIKHSFHVPIFSLSMLGSTWSEKIVSFNV